MHLLKPSCCVPIMLMRGTDSSLNLTDCITEPNKDRLMDQNSITFKEERGMFAGESHHTFQFPLLHVEVSEPTFSDSYWWQVMPLTRHRENGVCQSSHILHMPLLSAAGFITGDSQRKWTPFNKKNEWETRASRLIDLLTNDGRTSSLD